MFGHWLSMSLISLPPKLFTERHQPTHRLDALGRGHAPRLLELRHVDPGRELIEDAILPGLLDGKPHGSILRNFMGTRTFPAVACPASANALLSCPVIAYRKENRIVLPGIASAHSHAFQRALRARTQRSASNQAGSFWSWRGLMYEVAAKMSPDDVFALSRFAFIELVRSGVTAVGEFHYLHHDRSGMPYADRLELSDAVIRAAREAGLRITLLRVIYQRAGAGLSPEGAQRRFSDARLEDALADVEALISRYRDDPLVHIGIAPHSVRAMSRGALAEIAQFVKTRALPVHMHVAEQRREIEECVAEHARRPVELLFELGLIDHRFVAVHATHLKDHEAHMLGVSRSFACICRTTERDLGDGLPNIAKLRAEGVRLSVGADSHASSDPFEEARAIELDERSRAEARHVAANATDLLRALGPEGYDSIGIIDASDEVHLNADDIALVGAENLDDAVIWAGTPRAIREVRVAGTSIVLDGRHALEDEARAAYLEALGRLGLRRA